MTDSLLLNVLIFLYAIVAPGIAVARVALRETEPLPLVVIGLSLGLFGLPLLDFVVAMLLRTYISPALVLGVSTVILAITGWIIYRQKNSAETP